MTMEHVGDQWVRLGYWHDRRRRLVKFGHGADVQEVWAALISDRASFNGAEAAGMLTALAVERSAIPAGSHPLTLWIDPSSSSLCLVVVHANCAPVPEGESFPVIQSRP